MKTSAYVMTFLLVVAGNPSLALVSGFYDSAEKIASILASDEVAAAAANAPIGAISEIRKTADGTVLWQVRIPECDLIVELQPVAPNGPGKVTYTVLNVQGCS